MHRIDNEKNRAVSPVFEKFTEVVSTILLSRMFLLFFSPLLTLEQIPSNDPDDYQHDYYHQYPDTQAAVAAAGGYRVLAEVSLQRK